MLTVTDAPQATSGDPHARNLGDKSILGAGWRKSNALVAAGKSHSTSTWPSPCHPHPRVLDIAIFRSLADGRLEFRPGKSRRRWLRQGGPDDLYKAVTRGLSSINLSSPSGNMHCRVLGKFEMLQSRLSQAVIPRSGDNERHRQEGSNRNA
ncbi:hypothetical protein BC567DRAFT_34382 [Phyllosticta citribraziliensis]